MFPLDMHHIGQKQLTDKPLQQKLEYPKLAEYFGWMQFKNVEVITFKEKVWVPEDLQLRLLIGTTKHWDTLEVHGQSTQLVNHLDSQDSDRKLKI
jgi:hypothetical protein